MKLSDIMANAGLSMYAEVALVLFMLAFLAGVGFIAAYVGIEVNSVTGTLHSNLALGASLSVSLLGLAVGAVLWVRYLMPHVDLTEPRKPLASSEADRAAFADRSLRDTSPRNSRACPSGRLPNAACGSSSNAEASSCPAANAARCDS